ncbi:NIPSNAP family protein [Pseudomonadales bacterium]|nr:NIPSNAP family protein [Pseudomonadales bacterium]MDC1298457.1 NIPSNAP family protein [Pseudomonadales bacterium]
MYYEYRTYNLRYGEQQKYVEQLLDFCKAAEKHNFAELLGPFRTVFGEENEISYCFVWPSLAAREQAFEAISKDEELLKGTAVWWEREEKEGPLMMDVNSVLLELEE